MQRCWKMWRYLKVGINKSSQPAYWALELFRQQGPGLPECSSALISPASNLQHCAAAAASCVQLRKLASRCRQVYAVAVRCSLASRPVVAVSGVTWHTAHKIPHTCISCRRQHQQQQQQQQRDHALTHLKQYCRGQRTISAGSRCGKTAEQ